jgi:uracil-DNA glycosylase family 4
MNAEQELRSVAGEVAVCAKCRLHASRKNAVPGEGPVGAPIMFIGEGPGFHENEQGRPFVGAAGRFLEELLANIGMQREQVFICNVVKCRPPGNRDPQPDEIEACREYLERQIRAVNPKAIVTLGRFSMARYFPDAMISAIHGRARLKSGRWVVAMYHPAAALHRGALRSVIEEDFKQLPEILSRPVQADEEEQPSEPPQQMTLF